jgi:hypothetical protein
LIMNTQKPNLCPLFVSMGTVRYKVRSIEKSGCLRFSQSVIGGRFMK